MIWGDAQTSGPPGVPGPSGLVTVGPPGSASPCHLEKGDTVDTDDIVRRLNNGELGPQAETATRAPRAAISPGPRCEDGPIKVRDIV